MQASFPAARGDGAIYDLGMHNGSDIPYYLKKGMHVVAVEANPSLIERAASRWNAETRDGRLKLINAAIVPADSANREQTAFYVNTRDSLLSQLHEPVGEDRDFKKITINCISASRLILENGHPHYVKIDLEGIDHEILSDLFGKKIFPDYISAEYHTVRVFCQMAAAGYDRFKLLEGASVGRIYRDAQVMTPSGREQFSFTPHSAGPFGEDLLGPWLDVDAFFFTLANNRTGWKDIHAMRGSNNAIISSKIARRQLNFLDHLIDIGPSFGRAISARLDRLWSA